MTTRPSRRKSRSRTKRNEASTNEKKSDNESEMQDSDVNLNDKSSDKDIEMNLPPIDPPEKFRSHYPFHVKHCARMKHYLTQCDFLYT
jgi:hypothetical protein